MSIAQMKETLRDTLLGVYKDSNRDVDQVFQVAQTMIMNNAEIASKNDSIKPAARGHFKGELAEVLLEVFLMEYVMTHKNVFMVKGLMVPLDGTTSGFTELDLTLFTPSSIHLFEVKSYDGACKITDECTITSDRGSSTDVYEQNKLHLKALDNWIGGFLTTRKAFRMHLFSFADNTIEDLREPKFKKAIRVLDETNAEEVINSIDTQPERVNIKKVYNVINKLDMKRESRAKEHVKAMIAKNKE